MPKALLIPDPDTMLAERDGTQLYYLDARDEFPLYRRCKLIRRLKPYLFDKRRAAYLTWIIHEARFARGGDGFRIAPELFQWAGEHMAKEFDQAYLADSFGLTAPEIDALIAAERAKYVKSKG